jgi:hypothetical protein
MKFFVAAILMFGMLFIGGCKKQSDTGCDLAKTAADAGAKGIGQVLGCANVDAISADFLKKVNELDICKKQVAQGMVGDLVCPKLVDAAMSAGLSSLPPAWECKGGIVKEQAQTILLDACKKAITF